MYSHCWHHAGKEGGRERIYGYGEEGEEDGVDDKSRILIVKHSGPLCMYCRRREGELWVGERGRERGGQTGIIHTHCGGGKQASSSHANKGRGVGEGGSIL